MAKQDLKINFGTLDELNGDLYGFMRALERMDEALNHLDGFLNNSSGETIEALKQEKQKTVESVSTYKSQVNDVYELTREYIDEMTWHIKPFSYHAMTRVDRNDIWWNLETIDVAIGNRTYQKIKRPYAAYRDTAEENIFTRNRNKQKIEDIEDIITRLNRNLSEDIHYLKQLFNDHIVPYEETDNHYKSRARRVYQQYTDFWEGVGDVFNGVVTQIFNGIDNFLTSGGNVIINTFSFLFSGIEILITNMLLTIGVPLPEHIINYNNEQIDKFTGMLATIWNDPMTLLEGMAQQISDDLDEEGIIYVVGGIAGEYTAGWLLGQLTGSFIDDLVTLRKLSVVDQIKVLESYGFTIADGKVNGLMPVDDFIEKWLNSIHNIGADHYTLGRYYIPGTDSYITVAKRNGSCYFDLGKNWNYLKKLYNLTDDQMFDLFNKPFLDDIIVSGNPVHFSHNPLGDFDAYLYREWLILEAAGYVLDPDTLIAYKI